MPAGPPIKHTDAVTPSSASGESEYTTPVQYDDHPEKSDYGPIHTRFDEEIELNHPAPDIETLRQTPHLTAQLHEYNRGHQDGDWPFENDGTTLYDLAILDVVDTVLEVEDLSPAALDMPTRRFKMLFLLKARQPATLKDFYTYVKTGESVRAALGYRDAADLPCYETIRLASEHRLPEELNALERGQGAFEAAVDRAVYAVYRNGIQAPRSVADTYSFDAVSPPLNERAVPRPIEQTALRNWVQFLVDETVEPLTFHRAQPRTSFLEYIGAFATSALLGCGLQTVPNVADYNYPRETIPKGSGVGKYIKNDLPLDDSRAKLNDSSNRSITAQFDAVHRATLAVARQYGFFTKPRSLAVDLYRIEWDGVENEVTINRPAKSENDNRSEWTYVVLGLIDTDARFTLGTRWLPDKSTYPTAVTELSPLVDDFIDVNALYADSELISGALIDAFRNIADSEWVVRAPDHNTVITQLKTYTPDNHIGYVPKVSWNTTPSPAAVAYPYNSRNPSTVEFTARQLKRADPVDIGAEMDLSDFAATREPPESSLLSLTDQFDDPTSVSGIGSKSTHAAYLTDRSLPERSAGGIHFPYYQRWALEESINQISNDFMPMIHSSDEKLRLYGVNIAVLFQNWHTLINRAPSPELGLRRTVTHPELLMAIQDVAFNDSR